LLGRQAEGRETQVALLVLEFRCHGHPEDPRLRDHDKGHGVDRGQRAGREHRALHALLPAGLHEPADVGETGEGRLVDRRLGADRQRLADLRDHDADLPGRHLDPRVLRHGVDQDELDPQPRHQQVGLVAGLALERDRVVARQLSADPLADQPHFGRADRVDRHQDQDDEYERHAQHEWSNH
jgi:hypothetical protein